MTGISLPKPASKDNTSALWRFISTGGGGLLIIVLLFTAIMAIVSKQFLSTFNIFIVLREVSTAVLIGFSQMIVLAIGQMNLSVGAIGGLTMGMMTRTARGHTARPLRADAFDTACYLAIQAAALVRVGLPLAAPQATVAAVTLSALFWSAGFALFTLRYWPVLTRERLDGRPG